MRYDKSGTGWGNGDVQWACEAKRGNCTDFHAVVIGMARASGMAARFEIGFPLPNDRAAGEIPGYHCWAFLFHRQRGWVPVDASEGWKNQGQYKDYYLGRIGSDRVAFSSGRDIKLGQHGAPLNYFVTPYAEQGEAAGFAPVPMSAVVSFRKLAKT
jgi:transglutaminase-like putative cysteine protease